MARLRDLSPVFKRIGFLGRGSSPDEIFEMACHEGNEGLSGALSGTRYLENAADAAKKGSR